LTGFASSVRLAPRAPITISIFRLGHRSNAAILPFFRRLADCGPTKYAWQVSYLDESYLDHQRERRRLADTYAGMTDGELQRLARNAESLTELAWDALEDEMDRRHLESSDDPTPEPRQEMEVRELVTVRQFRDLPEALLAAVYLRVSLIRERTSGSSRCPMGTLPMSH